MAAQVGEIVLAWWLEPPMAAQMCTCELNELAMWQSMTKKLNTTYRWRGLGDRPATWDIVHGCVKCLPDVPYELSRTVTARCPETHLAVDLVVEWEGLATYFVMVFETQARKLCIAFGYHFVVLLQAHRRYVAALRPLGGTGWRSQRLLGREPDHASGHGAPLCRLRRI